MASSRQDAPSDALRRRLRLGPGTARELQPALNLSQPAFSRLARRLSDDLLVAGRARNTTYALRREIASVGRTVPVYEVEAGGGTRQLATLHAVAPEGFYVEALESDVASGFHRDLPFFLNDMRPSGYLGRLVPLQHPELELPSDVRLWSGDQSLRYLTRYGWNLSGALIAGDAALKRFLLSVVPSETAISGAAIPDAAREARYVELADDLMRAAPDGSSAGGEQPKFLATLSQAGTEVIVKFSPPVRDATSERFADLLVAEHVALEGMRQHGLDAAETRVVRAGDRTFLESVRFDRLPNRGRRGLLSLFAFDNEFVGSIVSWSESARRLSQQGHLTPTAATEIRRRELFSQLIANTDRHHGNLSFFVRGARIESLAPAYDVAPSHYAPRQGHLEVPPYQLPPPEPGDGVLWRPVLEAARAVWDGIANDQRFSRSFRALAQAQDARLEDWRRMAQHLPS